MLFLGNTAFFRGGRQELLPCCWPHIQQYVDNTKGFGSCRLSRLLVSPRIACRCFTTMIVSSSVARVLTLDCSDEIWYRQADIGPALLVSLALHIAHVAMLARTLRRMVFGNLVFRRSRSILSVIILLRLKISSPDRKKS